MAEGNAACGLFEVERLLFNEYGAASLRLCLRLLVALLVLLHKSLQPRNLRIQFLNLSPCLGIQPLPVLVLLDQSLHYAVILLIGLDSLRLDPIEIHLGYLNSI